MDLVEDLEDEKELRIPCKNCYQYVKENRKTFLVGLDEIQFMDAIAFIYGISWPEFENFSRSAEESLFTFCYSCTFLLSETYKARKKFEDVSHPSSLIKEIDEYKRQGRDEHRKLQGELEDNANIDLFQSANFDENESETEMPVIEEFESKYHLEVVDIQKSALATEPIKTERSSRSESTPLFPMNSIYLRHAVVKLEKLPPEELIRHLPTTKSIIQKGRKIMKARRKISVQKRKERVSIKEMKPKKVYRTSTRNSQYECEVCGKKFHRYARYKYDHLPRHFQSTICEICGEKFPTRYGYTRHQRMLHSEKKIQKVPCDICGANLDPNSLNGHKRTFHSGPRTTYKCDHCDKVFLTQHMYKGHVATHSKSFTPFLCGTCGKTFSSPALLKYHKVTHLSESEKKFSCEICSMKFAKNHQLKSHKQCHSTERQHICEQCGKTFNSKNQFQAHLRLHKELDEKGEMSAKCEPCGRFFKHSVSLYKHNARIHKDPSKKKIYSCSVCGKIVSSGTVLRAHEKLHKNNPEYKPRKKQTWKNKIHYQSSIVQEFQCEK